MTSARTTSIRGWSDHSASAAEQPTAVYGGDTITIIGLQGSTSAPRVAEVAPKGNPSPKPASASDDEYERQPEN